MDWVEESGLKRFFRARMKLNSAGILSHTRLPSPGQTFQKFLFHCQVTLLGLFMLEYRHWRAGYPTGGRRGPAFPRKRRLS